MAAASPGRARPAGRHAALAAIISLALVAGCTSAAPHPNTSPLSTAASAPPLYCGFVSKASVDVAVGETKLLSMGTPGYKLENGRRTLAQASCMLNGHTGQVFSVEVLPLGARPDLEQQVVDSVATGKEVVNGVAAGKVSYVFPASFGVGYAQTYPLAHSHTKAGASLLRGNYFVGLGLYQVAPGRDRLKDIVALTHQIVAFLGLPTAHNKPYPTPSPSP